MERKVEELRGLLLDSGDTLMRPRGGRWNPRFDFEEVVRAHLPELRRVEFSAALAAGDGYLQQWQSREAEMGYAGARAGYHRSILAALGVDSPSGQLLDDLDRPLPFPEIVEPFTDTARGLAELTATGWRIAVVADTSPLMVDAYTALGLQDFIEAFVISGELGFTKPDPRMYRTASDRLGLAPEACVFVDDNPTNLRGALELGYHVCGMARYQEPAADGLPWVRNLSELSDYLSGLRMRR